MIEAIVISLSVLLLAAYIKLGKNLSRPSVIYIGGFWVCSIVAYMWKEEWDLNKMSEGTFFMIVGGALLFFLVEWHDYRIHTLIDEEKSESERESESEAEPAKEITPLYPISSFKLVLFFVFQLLSFYMMAKAKMAYASTDDLATALVEINDDEKFNDTLVKLPFYINYPYNLCRQAGFIWCILLPYYQLASSKYKLQKYLLALNLVTIIGGIILSGGRMGILHYIISYLCFFYICYQYKKGWKWGLLPKKIMADIFIVVILFITLFQALSSVIGRENDEALNMYFAIYCGAQIKNLDDYIQNPSKQDNNENLFAQYTISNVYNNIGQRMGSKESRQYSAELPFNNNGKYPLGNVYSAYYNYYLDFGYWGIICAGVMSFVLAVVYRRMRESTFWETGLLNWGPILYSWLIPFTFMCFFANEFWGTFSVEGIIKSLLWWWLIVYYLQGNMMSQEDESIQDNTCVEECNSNEDGKNY